MSRIANVTEAMYGKEPSASDTSLAHLLDYYSQAHTKEEKKKWFLEYYKSPSSIKTGNLKLIESLPDNQFVQAGTLARIWLRGCQLPQVGNKLEEFEAELLAAGCLAKLQIDSAAEKKSRKKSLLAIQNANDLVSQIDEQIDFCIQNNCVSKFDMSQWAKRNPTLTSDIQATIQRRVQKLYDEVVLSSSDPDLAEAYSYLTNRKKRDFLAFLSGILSTKVEKASRKSSGPRKTKAKTPDKLVKSLKYLQSFPELRLTSIDPKDIIGATSLWVYNTKYRILTNYVSDSGLSVKGSTLLNISDASVGKKLRKSECTVTRHSAESVVTLIPSMGKVPLKKVMDNLTTNNDITPTGRINTDTVILRARK